jgi:hypothetical protein
MIGSHGSKVFRYHEFSPELLALQLFLGVSREYFEPFVG